MWTTLPNDLTVLQRSFRSTRLASERSRLIFNLEQNGNEENAIWENRYERYEAKRKLTVLLHSGEYVTQAIDLEIKSRGMNFTWVRYYRSQGYYSGVLGWGWDHHYNRRLQELPGGDILYFDGSGRR